MEHNLVAVSTALYGLCDDFLSIVLLVFSIKEVLIKSGAHIAPSDFLSACTKATQEYLRISRSFRASKMCAKSLDAI